MSRIIFVCIHIERLGGILFRHCPSVPLSVCLCVCLKLDQHTKHFSVISNLFKSQCSYMVWRYISTVHICWYQGHMHLLWSNMKVTKKMAVLGAIVFHKHRLFFLKSSKHCAIRKKCWLPSFSACPTMVSNALFLTLYSIYTHFNTSTTDSFWKQCGKRRNCSKRAISSYPTMFSTQSENCIPICQYFDIISLFAAELVEPKIGVWGKGLMVIKTWDCMVKGHGSTK